MMLVEGVVALEGSFAASAVAAEAEGVWIMDSGATFNFTPYATRLQQVPWRSLSLPM